LRPERQWRDPSVLAVVERFVASRDLVRNRIRASVATDLERRAELSNAEEPVDPFAREPRAPDVELCEGQNSNGPERRERHV
jgi:hypothetical protein